MVFLDALWLPILLSSVFVFVASSIIHMALPWHKGDYRQVPNEDAVSDSLRPHAIPPGDYMLPRACSMGDMKSPEFIEKMNKGPVMIATVLPNGPPTIGKSLIQWFLYSVIVGIISAYIAGRALTKTAPYLEVFRFAGTTAFLCYSVGLWQTSIWYRRSWLTTFKLTVDGLVYALLTAGVFGWLWPR